MDIGGNILVITAPYSSTMNTHGAMTGASGLAYVYTADYSATEDPWTLRAILSAGTPEVGGMFGNSVSFNGAYIFLGSFGASSHHVTRSGVVFSIEIAQYIEGIEGQPSSGANGDGTSKMSIMILLLLLPFIFGVSFFFWHQSSAKQQLHTPMSLNNSTVSPMAPMISGVTEIKPYEVYHLLSPSLILLTA